MAVKNLFNSGLLYTERREFHINPNKVAELYGPVAPFTSIMMAKGAVKTPDPDYKSFEHRSGFLNRWMQVNDATISSNYDTYLPGDSATVAGVDNFSGFGSMAAPSDYLLQLVFEVWDSTKTTFKGISMVYSVSGNAITFISLGNPRNANNYHTALADNDWLIVTTNAHAEGGFAPEANYDELEVVYNSSQIFKKAVEITGTLYETALKGYSNELDRLRKEMSKEMDYEIEKAFLFGTRAKGTGMTSLATGAALSGDAHADTVIKDKNGKTVRTTMGLLNAIYKYGTTSGDYQNIFRVNKSNYNYKQLINDGSKVFQFSPESGRLIGLCGQGALNYWSALSAENGFAKKSGFEIMLSKGEESALGFRVKTLEIPAGVIDLVYAPQLRGQYANTMVLFDESAVEVKQFRPMVYKTNILTDNDYDGIKDSYMYDAGLNVTLIEKHSIWEFV